MNGLFATNLQTVGGLAVTGSGEVSITGGYRGYSDFGGASSPTSQNFDFYLAHYNRDGGFLWARTALTDNAEGRAIAVDSTGAVYAWVRVLPFGGTDATAMFNDDAGVTLKSNQQVGVMVKYDSAGAFSWMHYFRTEDSSPPARVEPAAVAVSPLDGTAWFTARVQSNPTLDQPSYPMNFEGTFGEWEVFQVDAAGAAKVLARTTCSGQALHPTLKAPEALVVDQGGTAYLLGEIGDRNCSFDSVPSGLTRPGPETLTLAKLTSANAFTGATRLAGWTSDAGFTGALAVRDAGLWMAQSFSAIMLPSGPVASDGGSDIVIGRVALSSLTPENNGSLVLGGPGNERVTGLVLDDDGGMWLSGETTLGFRAGTVDIVPTGGRGLFIIHLTAPNFGPPVVVGVRTLPSTGTNNSLRGHGVDRQGASYVAGELSGTIDLGTGLLTAHSDAGAYVGRLP